MLDGGAEHGFEINDCLPWDRHGMSTNGKRVEDIFDFYIFPGNHLGLVPSTILFISCWLLCLRQNHKVDYCWDTRKSNK